MRSIRWMLALSMLALPASADLLETSDGRVLEGLYLGGTEQQVRFRVGDGVEVFLVEDVVQVRFTGPPSLAGAKTAPGATAKPAAKPVPTATATPVAKLPKAGTSRAKPPKRVDKRGAKAQAAAQATTPAASPEVAPTAAASTPTPPPQPAQPAPAPQAQAPAASAAPKLVRVDAGTRLRVRLVDGIDPKQSAIGDRFAATLETGLGTEGVVILAPGTKLYGQVAQATATGPVASRLKLELTELMFQGQLVRIVTGPHQLAETESAGPASAANLPVRPGISSGSLLEFRLLQPFELRVP